MIATDSKHLVSSIQHWLAKWLSAEFGLEATSIELSKPFLAYGMDSVQAMMLVGDLEVHLGLRLRPTLVWDYPNASCLAEHLAEQSSLKEPQPAQVDPIDSGLRSGKGSLTPSELIASVDELSEAEVDALLSKYVPDA